jgi:hypothetical protein
MGRPAKRLFGLNRASVESCLKTLNSTGPSSSPIKRLGAVQKQTQYTQRLSIRNEDGSRLTGRCRRVGDASFLWTWRWGGCSKMLATF